MTEKKVEISSLVSDSVKSFIRDLGFPIFLSTLLIFNSWQMQNYLITTNDKRDLQITVLAEAVKELSIATNALRKTSDENNVMLKELRIISIVDEKRKGVK